VDNQRPEHPAPLDLVPVTLERREQGLPGGVSPGGRGGVALGGNQLSCQQDGEDSCARRAAHGPSLPRHYLLEVPPVIHELVPPASRARSRVKVDLLAKTTSPSSPLSGDPEPPLRLG